MKRAVIQIRRDQDAKAALSAMGETFVKAWNSGKASDPIATFTFSSPAQLFTVLSPKRWELIEHLQKIGPQSVRGLARSLERDVKRVHDDVVGLIDWGIIERTEDGKVCVPYDVIHADFDLRAVA
jgi:predicted transcriptional regulator